MKILVFSQRERLGSPKIHVRQIGADIGRSGMKDRNEIIPLLHTLRRPTFFSRDHDFYQPRLRHHGYCLVYLDVGFDEVANYALGFLRHPAFRTQALRMGTVVRIRHSGLSYWQVGNDRERAVSW